MATLTSSSSTKADYGSFPKEGPPSKYLPSAGLPPRRATWITASVLIIADVIGLGIMGMADAFADLGWVLGFTTCVLMLPLNLYCGLLVHNAQLRDFPAANSLAEISREAVGPSCDSFGYWFAAVVVYSFIFFTLGDYVLSMGTCLKLLFYSTGADYSTAIWSLFAAAALLPFSQVRTLNDTRLLLWVNVGALLISVFVTIAYLISGRPVVGGKGPTAAVSTSLSWTTGVSGVADIAFAYVGALMYPEIIAEMEEPADFPKALYVGAPFVLISLMVVGCVGYGYLGSHASGLLIEAIPSGTGCSAAASLFLFVHLLITYLIKGTVLTRWIATKFVAECTLDDEAATSCRPRLVWLALSSAVVFSTYGVAVAVPIFENLTTLIGAVQTPLIGFAIPALFAISGHFRTQRQVSPLLWVVQIAIVIFGVGFCIVGLAASAVLVQEAWSSDTDLNAPNGAR